MQNLAGTTRSGRTFRTPQHVILMKPNKIPLTQPLSLTLLVQPPPTLLPPVNPHPPQSAPTQNHQKSQPVTTLSQSIQKNNSSITEPSKKPDTSNNTNSSPSSKPLDSIEDFFLTPLPKDFKLLDEMVTQPQNSSSSSNSTTTTTTPSSTNPSSTNPSSTNPSSTTPSSTTPSSTTPSTIPNPPTVQPMVKVGKEPITPIVTKKTDTSQEKPSKKDEQTEKMDVDTEKNQTDSSDEEDDEEKEDDDDDNDKKMKTFKKKFKIVKEALLQSFEEYEQETAFTSEYKSNVKRVKEDLNLFEMALHQKLPKHWEDVHDHTLKKRKDKDWIKFESLKKKLQTQIVSSKEKERELLLKCVNTGKVEKQRSTNASKKKVTKKTSKHV